MGSSAGIAISMRLPQVDDDVGSMQYDFLTAEPFYESMNYRITTPCHHGYND